MNAVSNTAYYCCGVRMLDAESKNSLISDTYAKLFMDEHGLKIFDHFKHLKKAIMSCKVRARIIDDHVREILNSDKDTQIVLIGAGFDSRAFRLKGGSWLEIDEELIIDQKNLVLPVKDCPNPLKRLAVDFAKNQLKDVLDTLDKHKNTAFIIEGVFMYLEHPKIEQTLNVLKSTFVDHVLICDLMDKNFIRRYMKDFLSQICNFGCSFKFYEENPQGVFTDQGYKVKQVSSIFDKSIELKQMIVPRFLIKLIYPDVFDGYTVNLLKFSHNQ